MSLGAPLSREQESLDALCKERKNDFIQSTRDKLSSISKTIENRALTLFLEGPHHDRPYGLPPDWSESGKEQIWWYILKFINEPEEVINASETCVLFQRLLQDKYRAVKLAEAVKVCVTKRNWMLPSKVLLDLRLVCRSAKNYVGKTVMTGKLNEDKGWVEYLIPGISLQLRPSRMQQSRLRRILSSLEVQNVPIGTFPVREVTLVELGELDWTSIRPSVTRLFELVGHSIHSFAYFTAQSSHNAYNILRGWASLLPNLEELTVEIRCINEALIRPFEAFPTLPHLKRYWEDLDGGFSAGHLAEILGANPTLELVKLSLHPENRLNALMAEGILDHHHQIQTFIFQGNSGLVQFGRRQINWPLTRLDLYLQRENAAKIPTRTLLLFVNRFGATLRQLRAYVSLLSDEATSKTTESMMMNLPNLVRLYWLIETDSQDLRFMVPLKKLEHFNILLSGRCLLRKEDTLDYLERFDVPRLFPAMRRIRVGKLPVVDMQTVWENGKGVL